MICYVDASVLLRLVFGEPDRLSEWRNVGRGVSSVLAKVECLRTIDRLRLACEIPDPEIARRRDAVFRLIESLEMVEMTAPVLDRASQPFPTKLGTLDAIHLATALLWRDQTGVAPTMATHDEALALAARSVGFATVGA